MGRLLVMNKEIKIPIPVDEYGWINHYYFSKNPSEPSGRERLVYIIESAPDGNYAKYQYNGVGCFQGRITGFLKYYFNSDLKWFSPGHWYTKTRWGVNYPKEIVFENEEIKAISRPLFDKLKGRNYEKALRKLDKEVAKHAIPVKDIIDEILQEVREKTGDSSWELDCDPDAYDSKWFEAHIPLIKDGKKYLLTWMNCD
jgi:hypothetical protein